MGSATYLLSYPVNSSAFLKIQPGTSLSKAGLCGTAFSVPADSLRAIQMSSFNNIMKNDRALGLKDRAK